MSSVGGAWSVALAAVTRMVTTKSLLGGTIVSANRSQVGSIPLALKQVTGFGAAHARPAHVIVGESGETVLEGGVAAKTRVIVVRAQTRAIAIAIATIPAFFIFSSFGWE
jgi:hypothetical protein